MLDGEVVAASVTDMPVGVKELVADGKQEDRGSVGVHRSEWRERVLCAGRAEGVGKQDSGQADRRAERSVLHEVVVQTGERLDVEQAPSASNGRGVSTVRKRISETEPRRKIAEVVVYAARRESRITGKQHAGGRQRKTGGVCAGNVAPHLSGHRIAPRQEG